MNKKAQGISINTIIVAAIALIVLIVLILIFTGRMGNWGKGLDDVTTTHACTDSVENGGVGGTWYSQCPDDQREVFGVFSDSSRNTGQRCCVPRS